MFFGTTATVFVCLFGFVWPEIEVFFSPVFGRRALAGWRGRDCNAPSRCPYGCAGESLMVIWSAVNE